MTTIPQSAPTWSNLTTDEWSSLTLDQWSNLDVDPGSFTATYDAWNRQISLTDTASGNTVQQNQYDARTFRTVIQSYTAGVLSETRHSFFSTDWRCIEERVGTATTADRQFVWGVRYIDDLVLRDRSSERLYALQDANWNMTSIVNTAGTVQERYAYSPYGIPTILTSAFGPSTDSSFHWETLYCGYRFDGCSGFFRIRFRDYQPLLGNWCQRDPLSYRAGTDLYEYVSARPQVAADALGLDDSEYIITNQPKVGTTQFLKDDKGEFGVINLDKINCIGHATGTKSDIQVNPDVSVRRILYERSFDCEKATDAKTCVSDCKKLKKEDCAMVYLYVKSKNDDDITNKIQQLGDKDPYDVGIGNFGGVDIHGLMGVDVNATGACRYTYVKEEMPKDPAGNGKLKYQVFTFTPTDDQPDFFEDRRRILGRWCCCKKRLGPTGN